MRIDTDFLCSSVDRRPLDPPPIVQIELDNATAQETQ